MILVDAHVHIYDCFDLQIFLDSAFSNFSTEAARLGHGDTFIGVLLLTETARENWFQLLKKCTCQGFEVDGKAFNQWSFHPTSEDCSLCARGVGDQTLFLIAGRQIVTAEDLEVLAIATDKVFKDGAPLEKVIRTIRGSDAIPVVPWGPGKWMGKRGGILRQLLNGPEVPGLFLGDNGNRPNFWPRPAHFTLAEQKGIRILPGSDPLPLASECTRAGSFGFSSSECLSKEHPARDLKRILMHSMTHIQVYGPFDHPFRFLRNQLILRIQRVLRS